MEYIWIIVLIIVELAMLAFCIEDFIDEIKASRTFNKYHHIKKSLFDCFLCSALFNWTEIHVIVLTCVSLVIFLSKNIH